MTDPDVADVTWQSAGPFVIRFAMIDCGCRFMGVDQEVACSEEHRGKCLRLNRDGTVSMVDSIPEALNDTESEVAAPPE